MITAITRMELRLRARSVTAAAFGLICLTAAVGALFPAFSDSIGNVQLPEGVSNLLGGGNYGTLAGWLQTEVVSVYGPLVVAGIAIMGATATTAGEEEAGILALVLAHPVPRARLLMAKSAALAMLLVGLAAAIFIGLLLGVAFAGGGIAVGNLAAVAVHLLFYGLAVAAFALALAAGTGRRGFAAGVAAAVLAVMFLVNGFAPSVAAVSWLKYLTVFWYYDGKNQLENGIDPLGLAVLAVATAGLVLVAVRSFAHRDLRG